MLGSEDQEPDFLLRARRFFASSLDSMLERRSEDVELVVLQLFRDVVANVPAYARFLSARAVDPTRIRTIQDFRRLPTTSKADYHQAHPLPSLCRGGTLSRSDFLALSSGSSGEPTVWPRSASDEFGTASRFEQVLVDGFEVDRKKTLGVVCFSLGSWVGGMYTTLACRHLASKGYPLTLVTPGNNRAEILRVLRAVAGLFDQVILFGYPPFLKDVIDAGRADGFDWTAHEVRLCMAGEVFSEEWRSLVCERLGNVDPCRHTASLYGTADGGVLANETPLSIAIRRFLAEQPGAARELFGEPRLPTLCQYDPFHRYFESDAEQLLFSADGVVPLLRYRILDTGGVRSFSELTSFVAARGFLAPTPSRARALPFVFVFGRSHFALSFYGANVYPENVAVGLEQPDIAPHVTGKFVMQLAISPDHDHALEIAVELSAGQDARDELASVIAASVRRHLERLNSEFANYAPAERRTPLIRLLPLGDPEYFPTGVKHRYTRGAAAGVTPRRIS